MFNFSALVESTAKQEAKSDLIDNPSPRCPCMLVLDISGSMAGAPIDQLNQGVEAFLQELHEDDLAMFSVDVGVVTAGRNVSLSVPFTNASNLQQVPTFAADGATPLGEAVSLALQHLEQRKREYQRNGVPYYQPWLVIISDGAPTDEWQPAATSARELAQNRKLVSLPVGVAGANGDILSQFSNRPAKALSGLKFREFFQWLSASMSRVSASNSTTAGVKLPDIDWDTSWDSV